jgi:disulfide bond formation protein DsbB
MRMSSFDLSIRTRFLLGFAACAGAMAFALYLEHGLGLEPCPLCVLQRVAMIAAGVVFLIAALHGPRAWGRHVYALLTALCAAAGAAIAGRHVWLQSLPADQVPTCGPPLDHLLKIMPWREALTFVLTGEGSCAAVVGAWLGISLPGWTLIGFVLLIFWAVYCSLPASKD